MKVRLSTFDKLKINRELLDSKLYLLESRQLTTEGSFRFGYKTFKLPLNLIDVCCVHEITEVYIQMSKTMFLIIIQSGDSDE